MAKRRMTVTGSPPARRRASIAVCTALFVIVANGMVVTGAEAAASGSPAAIAQRIAQTPDVSAELYWHAIATGRFELVAETEDAIDSTSDSTSEIDTQVWFDLDKPTGVDDLRNPYPENGQPDDVGAAIYLT